MSGHYFRNDGPCVWCKATKSAVDDRRAPPFCPERPDDDDGAASDAVTGY
jgi:hypothetical protein